MKIAYISEISPSDLNNWSGTPHHVYKILSENHTVVWLGEGMCNGAAAITFGTAGVLCAFSTAGAGYTSRTCVRRNFYHFECRRTGS